MFTCQEDKIFGVPVHSLKFYSDCLCLQGSFFSPLQAQARTETSENVQRSSELQAQGQSQHTSCWDSLKNIFVGIFQNLFPVFEGLRVHGYIMKLGNEWNFLNSGFLVKEKSGNSSIQTALTGFFKITFSTCVIIQKCSGCSGFGIGALQCGCPEARAQRLRNPFQTALLCVQRM